MTTLTSRTVAPTAAVPLPTNVRAPLHVTAARAVTSERIKLVSLRSTWFTLAGLLVLLVGIGVIAVLTGTSAAEAVDGAGLVELALAGTTFGVLVVGALGAVVGAREHASGLIRTTLSGVPRRGVALFAKAVVLTLAVAPTVLVGAVTALLVGGAIGGSRGVNTLALTDGRVLHALAGTVLYLSVVALVGLALGTVLRSVAGAVASVAGLVLVLPVVAALLVPKSWSGAADALPSSGGDAVTAVVAGSATMSPLAGVADLVAWAVLALGVATLVLSRRDA